MFSSGLLVVDKPKGVTSHDVVDAVRHLLGTQKVGHTGTLDPMATGVLPICFGKATKLVHYLIGQGKSYRATLRLGEITETGDADSPVIRRVPFESISEEQIRRVLNEFTGECDQIPPAYSAVKVRGVPLYKRARAGEILVLPSRKVTISRVSLVSLSERDVSIELDCSKGTYVRRLCSDIGDALGVGAHVIELRRQRSGPFLEENAVPLDRLARLRGEGRLETVVTPMSGILNFPRVQVSEAEEVRVLCGAPVRRSGILSVPDELDEGSLVAVHGSGGEMLALAVPWALSPGDAGPGETPVFKIKKVLSDRKVPNAFGKISKEPFKRTVLI